MKSQDEAVAALVSAWPAIVEETRLVLGSELHYQAMVYHCLRLYGSIPLSQIGMNVKMWISDPSTELFRELDKRKKVEYHGGFEPIPDVCVFSEAVAGDWRRRNHELTMESLLLAIELKASERAGGRLGPGEIIGDILKLQAHREESRGRGGDFIPVMMVIDTAPFLEERMTLKSLEKTRLVARDAKVEFLYVSQETQVCSLTGT
ncbi:hypothetical protein [Cyanobium sp. Morenito 9A2]|uniref:hypothetical protein n=1 Tax=Cyanobium sp. Morenito 9A2 TaxID=2823718 RepID=UPI0020CDBFB5|nr:hypothetical protein [Cyanobium sp. Morenito 9A2]MCP9850917.1 hypothetical protein [Cyanobium sp. Morenito 9A2]